MIDDPRYETIKAEEQSMQQKSLDLNQGLVEKSSQIANEQNAFLDNQKQVQADLTKRGVEQEQAKLEQVKNEQQKSFDKETRGAYTDYKTVTNQYGATNEAQADSGVTGTGYAESSKIRVYGEYQRRYSSARDTLERNNVAVDMAMSEARLSGDVQLAKQSMEIYAIKNQNTLRDFEFSSSLAMQQLSTDMNISNMFYGRQQDLMNSITQQQQMAYQKEQDKLSQTNWEKEFAAMQRERNRSFSLAQQKARTIEDDGLDITDTKDETPDNNITNETILKSKTSPRLSTRSAESWLDKNITSKVVKDGGISAQDLNSILTTGYKNKNISESDITKIAKTYGL